MNDPAMYPKIAIIDPQLTLTVPLQVTASTGLDVLSHAIESYWATIHQPVCSACSIYSARLVFEWLEKAYQNPNDLTAREKWQKRQQLPALLSAIREPPVRTPARFAD